MLSTRLSRLNGLGLAEARAGLTQCCASPVWTFAVLAGRPYADIAHLLHTAERILADLEWAQVEAAVAAHPRIGERALGDDDAARWSMREQAGAEGGEDGQLAALRARLLEYEARFGHRFLISARGLSLTQITTRLNERLGADRATERAATRRELAEITVNRLRELMADD